MRILVTNDDGMHASQLIPLIECCKKYGEVFCVVPKNEQSGKSHGIELHSAFEAKRFDLCPDVTAWYVDSTPADCVRFAILGLHEKFDLVISGINKGLNIGTDMIYSGTVGAACEANALGVNAMAISVSPDDYPNATAHLVKALSFIFENGLFDKNPLYNVNLPASPKGILITRQGGPYYSDDFPHIGNNMYRPTGKCVYQSSDDISLDTDAVFGGYISITPITFDRTNYRVYDTLKSLNK